MRTSDWRRRAFKLIAFFVLLALLCQPETWHLMLMLDMTSVDAIALLLEAQIALVLALVLRLYLKSFARKAASLFETILSEWSGPLGEWLWLQWARWRDRGSSHQMPKLS